MHRVSCIRMENFRSCRNVTPSIGGLHTADWAKQRRQVHHSSSQRMGVAAEGIVYSRFSVPEVPVEVAACIDGISDENLSIIPEEKYRKAIEPYCRDGRLWIRVVETGTAAKATNAEVWGNEQYSGEGLLEHSVFFKAAAQVQASYPVSSPARSSQSSASSTS